MDHGRRHGNPHGQGHDWFSPVDGHVETAWGGRLDYGEPASVTGTEGYFRVGKADGRWYFLDPDGGAVILHGTQHVRPGTSAEHVASFNSKFGSNAKWSAETGAMLASYGFNYISYGSNPHRALPGTTCSESLLIPASARWPMPRTSTCCAPSCGT